MSRQKEQSDLGVSLRDMATILETGKKFTRGAKNQLKVNSLQQGEKQSQMSFDSRKSVETRRQNKKNEKQTKKKQLFKISQPQQLPHYLGVPDLQKYITSGTLQLRTSYEIRRSKLVELGKNYFPSLMRVLLKNNLNREIYQVKRGQLKRQKTTKDQFLIEFQHPNTNRTDVRSITRQNGIVLIGNNLAMVKLTFNQWKDIFKQEIQEIKGQSSNNRERIQQSEPKDSHSSHKQDQQQSLKQDQQIQKKQSSQINEQPKIPQQKSQQPALQFVQILPDLQRQFTLQNQPNQLKESLQHQKQKAGYVRQTMNHNKIEEERYEQSQMVPEEQAAKLLIDEEIFKRFCLPNCSYILWPAIIYDTALGDEQQLKEIIEKRLCSFSDRDKTRLFQKIARSQHGFFGDNLGFELMKSNDKERQKMMHCFDNEIRPKIEKQIPVNQMMELEQQQKQNLQQQQSYLGSQLNLIVYPVGLNKLIHIGRKSQLQLFQYNLFPEQQFMKPLIFSTMLKQSVQQVCHCISRLNDFAQLQVTQTKPEDIRSSIDRLVKCQIEGKVYNGIVLRYSNLQKKMLVMVFEDQVKNQVKWLAVQQVYTNYTLPQIGLKSKFLLYDTNEPHPKHNTLLSLMKDIYFSYFYSNKTIANSLNINTNINSQNLSLSVPSPSLVINPSVSHQRCVSCFYPIHRLPFYKCYFCNNYTHRQCSNKTINKSLQINCQNTNDIWTCDYCQPCVVCIQPLKNKRISCSKCSSVLHQNCGKLKLQQNLHRDKYSCQNCIQCKICQKKLKNLDYILIKNGYQCINCYKAQQANEICHICKKQSDGRWAQCSRQFCGKWIHKNCDKYIQTRTNFFSTNNEEVYYCPFCRNIQKRRLVLKFIEIISIFDEYQYFISSDYEDILDYKYMVTNPMCFRKMYERCYQGCYDVNTLEELKKDFELIVSNALKYNMPKDQPHYQARILNVLGQFAFEKFREQLQCSEEQIIRGGLMQRMLEKKKELYRQVYERYLQIILNYGAKWSLVEVKRPKENVKAIEKMATMQLTQLQQYGFSSRHLLKDVFRSAMIKFKLKKKPGTIQNLFETQKVIEAFKSSLRQNFCYYHYWNSNTNFYCQHCMQYYCCVQKCYRHQICRYCGIKGCACDMYECGCPVMKEKQRKYYEKLLIDKYYDRREITQNYKLCLKCAFQKLNTKQCLYCQKSYQFYYDFETCIQCKKIYHKQCADEHASQSLSKFFFKQEGKNNAGNLFSTTLRLQKHCYECSISKGNKVIMFEKLKRQSLQKLAKIQKLSKYQMLILSILLQNGIKISLCDVLGLIMDNYDEFLSYESIFEQYRINFASVKFNHKLNSRLKQRIQKVVQKQVIKKEDNQHIEKLLTDIEQCNKLLNTSLKYRYLSLPESTEKININIDKLWTIKKQKQTIHSLSSLYNHPFDLISSNQINPGKIELLLQFYQGIKNNLKLSKMFTQKTQISNLNISNPQIPSKKGNGNNNGSDKLISLGKLTSNAVKSNKNNNQNHKDTANKLLFDLIGAQILFSSFETITINHIQDQHSKQNNKSSIEINYHHFCLLENAQPNKAIFPFKFITKNQLIYETALQIQSAQDRIIDEEQQNQQKPQQKSHVVQNYQPSNIDIEKYLQQMVEEFYEQKNPSKNQSLQLQLSKIHYGHTNVSKLSKYYHLSKIHSIITRFILKCFQYSKSFYRRGNTCLLKTQKDHWRVLKKCGVNNQQRNHQCPNTNSQFKGNSQQTNNVYDITLKKQGNKWFFSINENCWWVDTVQQIIQKLRGIVKLDTFRELADFLGFTFRLVPLQKANHFSKFLRTHPLDKLNPKQKKRLILELYERFQWGRNGSCKNKVDVNYNVNGQQIIRQEMREYVSSKKEIFYLRRRKQQKEQESNVKQRSAQPYITYEDMKRDLQEASGHPLQRKKQFEPKNSPLKQSRVFIGPSPIHKLGLFAVDNYPKYTTMIEYIGQIVSESTADVRQSIFHFGCYMFGLNRRNVDRREIIDATFRGNMARYLNHSCDPNCKAKIEVINNQPKIFIYSIRDIQQFEQLTYDYQFSVDANEKLTCTCGAKNCQGRLN